MSDHSKHRLRVAVFHDLPSGGAKRTLHAQVRELARRGNTVDAFVTSTADEDFLPLADVARSVRVIPVPSPPSRERILSGRPAPSDLVHWSRVFLRLGPAGREVAAAVDSGGYDVLLAHPSQFTQAPHVLRYANVPTAYYCHEPLRAAYEPLISPPHVRLAIRFTLGAVDRRNTRAAQTILTNSTYTAEQVRQIYGRPAIPAPPGVDLGAFRSGSRERGHYVLAVGALHPLKGIPFLLDVLHEIPRPRRPPLVVVSDRYRERDRRLIIARASELGVSLDLRQRVAEQELAGLYSGALAVLAAPHREPLGLVPLEAMASGTPVVGVAEGGLPETILGGETGYLAPRSAAVFAKRLALLLDSPARVEAMGVRGRAHVEAHWGWEGSVDRLLEILHRLRESHD